MEMNNLVAIVVPIYKRELSCFENISLQQLFNVLGGMYDIFFVAPETLGSTFNIASAHMRFFPDEYFVSVEAYSKLLLTAGFYDRFEEYEYILIYQLDAFVFEDKLKFFCELGYDYIGAPWLSGFIEDTPLGRKVIRVGNGGLSLRKVKSCRDVLLKEKILLKLYEKRNEDVFFAMCANDTFKVAPLEVALSFSFEREVQNCYQKNNYQLPFGCHAWEKYDLKFWEKYILKYGYNLSNEAVRNGMEDLTNAEEYSLARRNARLIEDDIIFKNIPSKVMSKFCSQYIEGYYLWGAGYIGNYVKKIFQELNIPLLGFVDKNENIQGKVYKGLLVYAPELIPPNSKIIVTTQKVHYSSVRNELEKMNFQHKIDYIFWMDLLPEDV